MTAQSVVWQPEVILRSVPVVRQSGSREGTFARVVSGSRKVLREYASFSESLIPEGERFLLAGQTVSCSHPLKMPFSRRDIMLAAKFRLAEIQAFGKSCTYSLKPKGAGWPEPEVIGRKYDEIRNARDFGVMIAAIKYSPDFLLNSVDPETDIFRIRQDLACQKLAKELELSYQKIPYAVSSQY